MTGQTIARPVRIRGIGPRSLKPVMVTLAPGRPESGIVFNGRIRALARNATVREHSTCLGRGRNWIRMVEHLLAACYGLGVTDLSVDVVGGELPFGDGSSARYVRAFKKAGWVRCGGKVRIAQLTGPVMVEGPKGFIAAMPARMLHINCLVRLPGKDGAQFFSGRIAPAAFERELAGARTFGPGPAGWSLEQMRQRLRLPFQLKREAGLVYPRRRRFPGEPCRHKALDLLGDLALLGRPLRAEVFAFQPGHRLNLAFVRHLERRLQS